jgi:hypothetical protein
MATTQGNRILLYQDSFHTLQVLKKRIQRLNPHTCVVHEIIKTLFFLLLCFARMDADLMVALRLICC